MKFLHKRGHLDAGDVAEVSCDHQCNVLLMDDSNFRSFRFGSRHTSFGGFYKHFPARIEAPSSGYWNVVLHLGGASATIKHRIEFKKP